MGRTCNQHGSKFKSSWKHFLKNENTLLVHAKNYNKIHCVKSVRIRSYSVRMRENADYNNSEYGHFSPSDKYYYRRKETKTCQKEITRSHFWQDRQGVQDAVAALTNWIVILSVQNNTKIFTSGLNSISKYDKWFWASSFRWLLHEEIATSANFF